MGGVRNTALKQHLVVTFNIDKMIIAQVESRETFPLGTICRHH